jgi:hypothetical protein
MKTSVIVFPASTCDRDAARPRMRTHEIAAAALNTRPA